ncbi:hypothetical protein [Yoonia sp. BS5-3]|uniref:Transmembrane protein n=1 Tax=Yoonia phaeophyticola TaxID=3137369 RepID=A0ABZ2V9K4_9RHOB
MNSSDARTQNMFKSISDLFKNEAFVPSASVFPEIDNDRLSRELDLKVKGGTRGRKGLPRKEDQTLDQIELEAVSKVEALRRRGLENFETNRQVYSERLNQVGTAKMQVETVADDTKSRFLEETIRWRSAMVAPRERVQETYNWRNRFREIHKLERPAKKASSLVSIIGLGFVMVMLESAGNAYLFAQKNTLGLLGGLMAAFLVSFGNVAISTLLGMATRYINIRGISRIFLTLLGLGFFLLWLVFATGYNLGVAHFRDAVETVGEWREAGEIAMQTLVANPISLHTMESYILFLLGAFISIISLLKGYHSSDPYPGYSKVQADLTNARESYVDHLEEALETLSDHRDEAVETLHEALEEVQRNIRDSIDALYGQRTLTSGVSAFLEQTDIAANFLLSVYREANRAARPDGDEVPPYFLESFQFKPFNPPALESVDRSEAEGQVREIEALISKTIKEMFDVFEQAVQDHYELDELEGVFTNSARVMAGSRTTRSDASALQVISGKSEAS